MALHGSPLCRRLVLFNLKCLQSKETYYKLVYHQAAAPPRAKSLLLLLTTIFIKSHFSDAHKGDHELTNLLNESLTLPLKAIQMPIHSQ